MKPPVHLAVSAAGGGLIWSVTGEPWSLPVAVASGVAIDADYVLNRIPIVTKLLHGWEWLVISITIGVWTGFPWWITAIILGYSLHIAGDQITHPPSRWWNYVITYRTWKGYSWREIKGLAHWGKESG